MSLTSNHWKVSLGLKKHSSHSHIIFYLLTYQLLLYIWLHAPPLVNQIGENKVLFSHTYKHKMVASEEKNDIQYFAGVPDSQLSWNFKCPEIWLPARCNRSNLRLIFDKSLLLEYCWRWQALRRLANNIMTSLYSVVTFMMIFVREKKSAFAMCIFDCLWSKNVLKFSKKVGPENFYFVLLGPLS